ncbi:urease accessory protein UreF [Chitinimonas koreensis]|uniref:urease accessory protein UreF n=1 Tax=Chitinimonas koreensis TaxID=356302 RepID=UPI000411BF85|nr:urease accessory UreF family protein [Chitinimonas koreensis]QNM96352.1 urease accessory protein UreF [Chitinimonas koreensis]
MAASALALGQLLRLASPALPVGAYSYSQGLEWAIEAGTVRDAATAERWIADLLQLGLAHYELPLLAALQGAWQAGDAAAAQRLNDDWLASRETAELRAETLQMGYSMARLLEGLPDLPAAARERAAQLRRPCWPALYALAAAAWGLDGEAARGAYLWSWLENQVMVLMKALPLGQAAGQQLLSRLLPLLAEAAAAAPADEDDWHNLAPGFALAACLHETQYSRLFRS